MTGSSTVGTLGQGACSPFLMDENGFLSLFGGGSAIGLSIGTSSVKLVELARHKKSWKLIRFSMLPLPEDSVVNREVMNHVAVVDVIKQLVKNSKISGKNVCTGLSGPSLIIKRMTLEVPNKKELQDAVFWEAEQYLPFDPSEVSMDFHVVSRGKDAKTEVVFVAAKTSVMDSYTTAIADAGLKTKTVDSEFFALQNIFEANFPTIASQAVALVDIGAVATKVVVIQEGVPLYTKDTTIGGRNLTSDIQKHLNLNYDDAEALKVGNGNVPTPQEVAELMQVTSENFAVEVKRALDFYNASSSGAPVAYVLLTGGSSKIPDLSRVIEEKVGLPVQLLNPFTQVTYDEKVFSPEMIQMISPLIAVPMGLAIRGGVG